MSVSANHSGSRFIATCFVRSLKSALYGGANGCNHWQRAYQRITQKKMAKRGNLVRIGTRGSPLARIQADEIKRLLMAAHPEKQLNIVIQVISTAGDRIQNQPLSEVGGKGLFTFEIEQQLSAGELDIAVHSAKDMATKLPDGLELVCFPKRGDVADAFISSKATSPAKLPHGAVVGSASLRRQAQLLRLRPDLKMVLLRGNVGTRLKKIAAGEIDATLLAVAGLKRLGMTDAITSRLPLDVFPPAPGQGAICVEARGDDQNIQELLSPINHLDTQTALKAERAFLATLDGSCRTPIAAHATITDDRISFHGMILKPDGSEVHEHRLEGAAVDAAALGNELASVLKKNAGTAFFKDW